MMDIKVVIGANFGDEGKGLMTDYFSYRASREGKKVLNILHNGGAQRGHTVTAHNGTHVFHHIGSGTLSGADTYLAKEFILNPLTFREEFAKFCELCDDDPKIFVSDQCKITTPFDMIINQIIEDSRGNGRHGSCGFGIYETLKRCEYNDKVYDFNITSRYSSIYNILRQIQSDYGLSRLKENGISEIPDRWCGIYDNDNIIINYIDDIIFMKQNVEVIKEDDLPDFLSGYGCLIFENGQGLLLDKDNIEYVPNLTPSKTDLTNPVEIINRIDKSVINSVEACYVTRTYLTRHGAGRLDNECDKSEIAADLFDETNIPNEFQGSLRYAKHNVSDMLSRVKKDFEKIQNIGIPSENITCSTAITHCNITNSKFVSVDDMDLYAYASCFHHAYLSFGKEYGDIMQIMFELF